MKVLYSALGAAALFGVASAADADAVKASYTPGAFADADAQWLRNTANRVGECGRFGKERRMRVEVLLERYNAIGDAIAAGDDAGASNAADRLARAINANSRFEKCWDRISRRNGVSGDFRSLMND